MPNINQDDGDVKEERIELEPNGNGTFPPKAAARSCLQDEVQCRLTDQHATDEATMKRALSVLSAVALALTGCNSHDQASAESTEINEPQPEELNQLASDAANDAVAAQAVAGNPVDQSNPNQSALSIIRDAGHDCSAVVSVSQLSDSSMATCEDGERYRLSRVTVDGEATTLAMKCSALEARGISSRNTDRIALRGNRDDV